MSTPTPTPLDTLFSQLIERLVSREVPCERHPDGSCIREFDTKRSKGKLVLWYGSDCKAALKMCDACLAYWQVAVARNLVAGLASKVAWLAARGGKK